MQKSIFLGAFHGLLQKIAKMLQKMEKKCNALNVEISTFVIVV